MNYVAVVGGSRPVHRALEVFFFFAVSSSWCEVLISAFSPVAETRGEESERDETEILAHGVFAVHAKQKRKFQSCLFRGVLRHYCTLRDGRCGASHGKPEPKLIRISETLSLEE